jgi:hypothetical protein
MQSPVAIDSLQITVHHLHRRRHMGFRFRRSIKIASGIRLNVSKSGVSASIGRRGATINISDKGAKATVGIPGTGISYSENLSSAKERQQSDRSDAAAPNDGKNLLIGIAFIAALILVAWVVDKL